MTTKHTIQNNTVKFRGYYVMAGALMISLITGGSVMNAFGVLLPEICDGLQWSRASAAGALSTTMMAFGLPSFFYGILVNKLGPRKCIILGNLFAALGLIGASMVNDIWQFYGAYLFIGAGAGLGGFIPCSTLANNWFIKKRSIAMSMIVSGAGLAGFIFPPITTILISNMNLQTTYLILSGLVFAGTVLLSGVVLIRNRPEDIGQKPDGIIESHVQTAAPSEREYEKSKDWSLVKQLKKRHIWLITIFVVANGFAFGIMITHQVAYINDIGFDAMTAATTMSTSSISQLIGGIVFGILAIRFNIRYLATINFLFQLISILILLTTRNLFLIYIYSLLMGFSIGSLTTAMPTFLGFYFPRQYFSRLAGFIMPFYVIGQALSATIAGAIYDATNNYKLAFLLMGACSTVGMISAYSARKPDPETDR